MEMIQVPVSPGELLDKITILEIKAARMEDPGQRANVKRELELLEASWREAVRDDETTARIHGRLRTVNETLWEVEDAIRECERAGAFDQRFVDLARSVYTTNDERARIKRELNRHLGSQIIEEKSYRGY